MRIKLLIYFFALPIALFGQGVCNNWLLGYAHGIDQYTTSQKGTIDFNAGFPNVIPTTRKMNFFGTQGNISDINGNILMYSNGIWVANSTGDTMMNGNGLNPGQFADNHYTYGSTISHGNLFIPYPGDSSKIVLFHQTGNYAINLASSELFYSVIDLNLDSGLGGVTLKNQIAFSDTISWGFAACKHANGRDWWIIAIKDNSDVLYKVLFTTNGISTISTQNFGSKIADLGTACLPVFSLDGTKFAFSTAHSIGGPLPWVSRVNYFDFDRCTGVFSNHQSINITDGALPSGTSFSPNGNFLYAVTTLHVYQIGTANIPMLADSVATYDGFLSAQSPTVFAYTYLAADGKIYIASGGYGVDIHYINYPDSLGLACDVQQHALHIPCYHLRSVPNHPNYFLGAETGSICDSLTVGINTLSKANLNLKVFPNPLTGPNLSISYLLEQNKEGIIEIIDINGRITYYQVLPQWSTVQNIAVPNLHSGMYLLRLKSGNSIATTKMVVQ